MTLIAALTLGVPGVAAATPLVFTVAGVESLGAAAPALCNGNVFCSDASRWPGQWTATARRFAGECLDHFADGSLLLCSGGRLFRVTPDGRAAALDVRGVALGFGEDGLYVT